MFLSVNILSLVNNYSLRRISKRSGNDKIHKLKKMAPLNSSSTFGPMNTYKRILSYSVKTKSIPSTHLAHIFVLVAPSNQK